MTVAMRHALAVAGYPDWLLDAVIKDLGGRNLRDYKDNAVRWAGERCKAARAERRRRNSR